MSTPTQTSENKTPGQAYRLTGCFHKCPGLDDVRNSVTPEIVVQIVEFYEVGMSARQVGLEVGLHRESVMRHLRSAGARIRRQGLDADAVEQARELYLSGKTLAQVGIVLGVAQGTVGRYLHRHGVQLHA